MSSLECSFQKSCSIVQSRSDDTPPITMFLCSKNNPDFKIEVGPSVIKYSSILTNVLEHTDNSSVIDIEMSEKELEKFVELHNHFSENSVISDKDIEWTNAFFNEMSDDEFKNLCFKAEYLDSQRFLEAACDFVFSKIEELDVKEIQSYLNVSDDYTVEERQAIEEHALKFFIDVSIE